MTIAANQYYSGPTTINGGVVRLVPGTGGGGPNVTVSGFGPDITTVPATYFVTYNYTNGPWTINSYTYGSTFSSAPLTNNVLTVTDGPRRGRHRLLQYAGARQYLVHGIVPVLELVRWGLEQRLLCSSSKTTAAARGPRRLRQRRRLRLIGCGGYAGGTGIVVSPSVGILFTGTSSTGYNTNGGINTPTLTSPVNLGGHDPLEVTINYIAAAQLLSWTVSDTVTGATFSSSQGSVNIASITGGTSAYVGVSVRTEGNASTQTISNFVFNTNSSSGTANILPTSTALTISSGTLDLGGTNQTVASLTMGASGALDLYAGTVFTSSGAASLAGTLNLLNFSAGTAELMAYSAETGQFAKVSGIPSGYSLAYTPTELDLISGTGPFSGARRLDGHNQFLEHGRQLDRRRRQPGRAGQRGATAGTDTAAFSGSGAITAITLDINPNLAALSFSNANYTLTGGTVTLQSSTGTASVTVTSGVQTIASAVNLVGGGLDVAISGGGTLGISGNISDDFASSGIYRSLTLDGNGSGQLVLSGTNTYAGGTIVNAGTLLVMDPQGLLDGSNLTVGAGAVLFDAAVAGLSQSAAASGATAVPEPGALVLIVVALGSAVLYGRGRKSWRLKATAKRLNSRAQGRREHLGDKLASLMPPACPGDTYVPSYYKRDPTITPFSAFPAAASPPPGTRKEAWDGRLV